MERGSYNLVDIPASLWEGGGRMLVLGVGGGALCVTTPIPTLLEEEGRGKREDRGETEAYGKALGVSKTSFKT